MDGVEPIRGFFMPRTEGVLIEMDDEEDRSGADGDVTPIPNEWELASSADVLRAASAATQTPMPALSVDRLEFIETERADAARKALTDDLREFAEFNPPPRGPSFDSGPEPLSGEAQLRALLEEAEPVDFSSIPVEQFEAIAAGAKSGDLRPLGLGRLSSGELLETAQRLLPRDEEDE